MSISYNNKASQLLPFELCKKVLKSKSDKVLLDEFNTIVMKYYPNYSKDDIINLYQQLSKSGCTYATMANLIIDQFNGDFNSFRTYFGDDFLNSDGSVNYNKLMVDIFACISQMVELKVTNYKTIETDDPIEAATTLLGGTYKDANDAYKALFSNGWIADGFSSDGKLLFVNKRTVENYIYRGSYREIALNLFNIDDFSMTKEKLEELLKTQKCSFSFSDIKIQSKLSGLEKIGIENIKKWIDIYFEKSDIKLELDTFYFRARDISFDEFVVAILSIYDNGYYIDVSPKVSQDIWMTDGRNFGWESVHNHAMNFLGFDSNGDILVCSWGKQYTIPKEYYNKLDYTPIKLVENNRDLARKS